MSDLVHRILGLPGWLVLLVAGLVVFAEDALALGFVLPGETVTLLAGAATKLGHVSLVGVLVVVVAAAIIGDSVGYEVGRHLGPRVLRLPILRKRQHRVDDAQAFLARRGGAAVFLGRWTAFLRAVLPFLAGAARMRYPTFLAWNAAGGLGWRDRGACRLRRRRLVRAGGEDVRPGRRLRRPRHRSRRGPRVADPQALCPSGRRQVTHHRPIHGQVPRPRPL